ncbi:MAG: Ig-like domain-containing protein [Candidatus Thorarchaeota archaeon]
MNSKYFLLVVISIILMMPGISPNTPTLSSEDASNSIYRNSPEVLPLVADIGGEDPLITNVIRNGGFEETDAYNGPEYWEEMGCAYVEQNGSYQDRTHTGAYAGRLYSKGSPQFFGSAQYNQFLSTIPLAYLDQKLSIDFFYFIESIPSTSSGYNAFIRFEVKIYNNLLQTLTINYLLSYENGFSYNNYTNQANIKLNSSTGIWNNLARNITSDYEAVFGAIDSSLRLSTMAITVWSPEGMDTASDFIFDDLTLRNATGYDFITDGDFESGQPSGFQDYRCNPSSALLSLDKTEGLRSVNLTAEALVALDGTELTLRNTFGYPAGYFVTGQGTGLVEFDWKYADAPVADSSQLAYFYLHAQNTTHMYDFYWYLGRYLNDASFTNTSNAFYFTASGYGNRDAWQHESINLDDVFTELSITNVTIQYLDFYIGTGDNAGSFVSLLLDDFSFMDYPAHDPGFEQDWRWNVAQQCTGWTSITSDAWQDRTDVSHSGDWAAMVSVTSFVTAGFHRNTFLPLDRSIYTSFWYRLVSVVPSGSLPCYALIDFSFDNDYHLEYYLGGSATAAGVNTSLIARYYAEDYSTTGTWLNLVRNPFTDISAVFGESNWNITNIELVARANGAAAISAIFDDINFIKDTHGPEFSPVFRNPQVPTYYTPVTVSANVTDNFELIDVTLSYNNGSWYVVEMTKGISYEATIPVAPYGTLVEYYVNATDYGGNETVSSLETYTVGDDIDPLLDVTEPSSSVVQGQVEFTINGTDEGSGIAGIEVFVNGSSAFTDANVPSTFLWNTTDWINGEYNLTFVISDNAGNSVSQESTFTVNNPEPTTTTSTSSTTTTTAGPPPPSEFPLETAIIAGGVAIFLLLIVAVCRRRK